MELFSSSKFSWLEIFLIIVISGVFLAGVYWFIFASEEREEEIAEVVKNEEEVSSKNKKTLS